MKRRAYTLIELLTVMSIMAMLGVAATAGYAALQRGMRERAAIAGASALFRSAKERAAVDRVPTAVFCYNKMLRQANEKTGENAEVVGVVTAIRRAGRISFLRDKFLYDEFGDLEQSGGFEVLCDDEDLSPDGTVHNSSDLQDHAGMRLWKFPTSSSEMEYSIVADAVWLDTSQTVAIFSDASSGGETNCLMGAFYDLGRSQHKPNWKVGTAYGFEIGEIQLPKGFIFGSKIPTDSSRIELEKVYVFDPESSGDIAVDVYTTRPDTGGRPQKFKKAGQATSEETKGL